MSAFLVSDAHLDALVMTAIFGVKEATALSGHWHVPYFDNQRVCIDSADLLGEVFLRTNEASVAARYPSDKTAPAPAYRYSDKYPAPLITAVAALKLLNCYTYQSCEHDGWDASPTKRFCNSLRDLLVASLPGYEAAPWAID